MASDPNMAGRAYNYRETPTKTPSKFVNAQNSPEFRKDHKENQKSLAVLGAVGAIKVATGSHSPDPEHKRQDLNAEAPNNPGRPLGKLLESEDKEYESKIAMNMSA